MWHWLIKKVDPHIRLYSILPLLTAFGVNMVIYSGTMALCANWKHFDFTTSFDRAVPVIPSFMYIYFGCYIFWIINYILIGHLGKEHFYKYITADILSRFVCGLFFVFLPTTNLALRETVTLTGSTLAEKLLQFLYMVDQPTNLFPSIHCLVSWFCFIGIRGQKAIPKWYRVFSCIFAILVFISTQVTKQHYIVDVLGGVILAEVLYYVTNHRKLYLSFMSFFERLNERIAAVIMKERKLGEQKENNT